jgi:hypothetical protein
VRSSPPVSDVEGVFYDSDALAAKKKY